MESVIGFNMDLLELVLEKRTLNKMLSIMFKNSDPLYGVFSKQKSMFTGRFLSQSCATDRLRKSFVSRVIFCFNTSLWCLGTWFMFLVMLVPQPLLILSYSCTVALRLLPLIMHPNLHWLALSLHHLTICIAVIFTLIYISFCTSHFAQVYRLIIHSHLPILCTYPPHYF